MKATLRNLEFLKVAFTNLSQRVSSGVGLVFGVFAVPVTVLVTPVAVLAVAEPLEPDLEAMNVGFRPLDVPKPTFIPSQPPGRHAQLDA